MNRTHKDHLFRFTCILFAISATTVLGILLLQIVSEGAKWITLDFLKNFPSRLPSRAGIGAGMAGSLWLMGIAAMFSVPVGIFSAIFLEEYLPKNRINFWLQINIGNLAGLPSIVYGLLGLAVFVRVLGFGRNLWAGGLTLGLLILPVIIISTQESIRAVPQNIRLAAYALGARKWQVTFMQVLPAAIPGITTGVILSLSRAIGETAPLIVIGALSFVSFFPQSPSDSFTALPIQIYNWSSRPQEEFHGLAAGGILVLLAILFALNLIAIIIRERRQRYKL
ncbi:MAG: phosphate ABC transporter, permease protein PstA [Proteobacteria bacterium SG_bin7]|nr:MAG: phosphate ABC transporter, permease protein PstA [Proteobacteria bacterium SG_bin7]